MGSGVQVSMVAGLPSDESLMNRNSSRRVCIESATVIAILFSLFSATPSSGQGRLLDNFENLTPWKVIVSDGVLGTIERVTGLQGNALGLRFSFVGGSGYAIVQRPLHLHLPANYRFTFYLRGDAPVNNFELKLLDSLGNVYWLKSLNMKYPTHWEKRTIRQRQITFAWGPSGGGKPAEIDRIEFVVSAGTGGSGIIAVDELRLETIDESEGLRSHPVLRWSTAAPGSRPRFTADRAAVTGWHSLSTGSPQWLLLDFDQIREVGGLIITWDSSDYSSAYDVELSDDGLVWANGYSVRNGNGGKDVIPLQDVETRFIRLAMRRHRLNKGIGIRSIALKGPEFSASGNALYADIASSFPRGYLPKYFCHEMSFWTISGVSGDTKEALINEEGMVEVDKAAFSLEPFLFAEDRLITWADVKTSQALERGYLPIPSVQWRYGDIMLTTRMFACGPTDSSVLLVTYILRNNSAGPKKMSLFVAVRPFQVKPPSQFLNTEGGVTNIRSLRYQSGTLVINNNKHVLSLSPPSAFGATEFDGGDIAEYICTGKLPPAEEVTDHFERASGAFRYDVTLQPAEDFEVTLAVPFHGDRQGLVANIDPKKAHDVVLRRLSETIGFWEGVLNRVQIHLPAARDLENTVKSNLAYILINRDGPAIQPGSRSYERSWIRDGSLTSAALLRFGQRDEVREFIEWYSKHQYPSGKVPCVVDFRGADPVPENDSHGELIFAIMQYFLFTKDTVWLNVQFPHVLKAVRYIQSLRAERKTDIYKSGDSLQRACYGLVPESISHEGYSSKPMHSYWDDFFVLRGLKDAASIAGILGKKDLLQEFSAERDDMLMCLYTSMRRTMQRTGIDYIPGCAELGDFDATSTSIGVNPGDELGNIPEPALHATFDRYYEFFSDRAIGRVGWNAYTPYEVRIVGTYVFLGQKRRALELLNFFMRDRRPPAWNHWAEVVWHDAMKPAFIGDMPHTWVGSDFLRSVRSMFVYERTNDTSLVLGAGIPEEWIQNPAGVSVAGFPTYYGSVSLRLRGMSRTVEGEVSGSLQIPPGKIHLISPYDRPLRFARVNGLPGMVRGNEIIIEQLPASVQLQY